MALIWSTSVTLALVGLLAGLHATGQFVLNPPLRSLDFGQYLTFKRLLDRDAPRLAKPLMLVSLFATALTVVIAVVGSRPLTALVAGVALVALIVTLLAILRGDLPINQEMATWNDTVAPDGWEQVRARWEGFFLVRVVATSVALAASVVAAVGATLS